MKPAKIAYRQLTDREHTILRVWETVPKELWSDPDLFTKTLGGSWTVHNKAYDTLMVGGVAALGFSIQRCFDFCLELIDKLDAAENNHLDSVEPLLALLQKQDRLCHYVYEKAVDGEDEYGRKRSDINDVVVFKKECGDRYYSQPIRETNWIRKWQSRFGKHSFTSHENQLIGYRSSIGIIKKQSFVLSEHCYDDIQIYPEITQYLKTSNELRVIQMKFHAMARSCVKLFGIDDKMEKSTTFMPCRVTLGDKSFYLRSAENDSDMMLTPQLESNWSLDDAI